MVSDLHISLQLWILVKNITYMFNSFKIMSYLKH